MDYPSLHRQSSYGVLNEYALSVPPPEPRRSAYFDSNWNLYASDWAHTDSGAYVAVGTLNEGPHNRIHVLSGNGGLAFANVADGSSVLPQTRVQWDPSGIYSGHLKLLTSSDCLRMWNFDINSGTLEALFPLVKKSKRQKDLSPLTSFDWCTADPNIAITSSIDTMCTVWDLSAQSLRTYLIAHDTEVFDVAFVAQSADKFMSCGADGSARLFDLRSLARSTIMFTAGQPLLRVAPNPSDPNIFATLAKDSNEALIIDIRSPRNPVQVLSGHSDTVNVVKWAPMNRHVLATGSDDSQLLVWDLANPNLLSAAYTERSEINNLSWSPHGNWIGCVAGRSFQAINF